MHRAPAGLWPILAPSLLLAAAGCTAGDPLGLYHPYHEHFASAEERGAAFAAHSVAYGTHENCGRRLAGFVGEPETEGEGPALAPIRISANEAVGYRRFGAEGEAVLQEYRCIDGVMHFRAWTEPAAGSGH